MTFPQTINASASPEVQVNENFLGIAWTGCYSNKPSTTTGLVRGYNGGRWGGFSKSDENHTFGASVTTYVSVDKSDGTLDFSTTNTNYNNDTDYARVEIVVTDGSGVTGVTDDRGGPGGVHGGGGSTGGSGAATTQPDEMMAGYIGTVADKDYKIVVKAAHGGTITETTTISESGTVNAQFKINTTALGGSANSVSTSEVSQAHASANVFSAGDDIVITTTSNSACLGMSFTIKYTRTLA